MTELLTQAEYSALADSLDFPRSPFIDGKYQIGHGPMMETSNPCLLYTSPSPRDGLLSRMPSSA